MFPGGLIVSIQPRNDSAFIDNFDIIKFAKDCDDSCVAFRIEDSINVSNIRNNFLGKPIIGLSKKKFENDPQPVITPLFLDAKYLSDNGANYIAMECSDRTDFKEIHMAVDYGIKVIADVADVGHAILAEGLGCVAITTAIYGYVGEKKDLPGLSFLNSCVKK
jgi:putative N-acetylmannosamine-6-phosphate epimerase